MYDVIVIGTGAAGYAAALYAARYQLKTLIIGKEDGGMTAWAHKIENYPGFEEISGIELMQKFRKHAEKFDVEIKVATVTNISKENDTFQITDDRKELYNAKTIIMAMGTKRRKLGILGEEKLFGKGVSYCTTCDGLFFRNKDIAIIGGGDSALTGALYLSNVAKKLYLIHRRDEFRAEPITIDKVIKNKNIEIIYNNAPVEIMGETKVEKIKLKDLYNGSNELLLDGVFVEIGATPSSELAVSLDVNLINGKFIEVKADQSTNIAGVFAAGDITSGSNNFHQAITAAAEAVIAADSAFNYLSQ